MSSKRFVRDERQCIIYTDNKICNSKRDVLHSDLFEDMVGLFVRELVYRDPRLLAAVGLDLTEMSGLRQLLSILRALDEHSLEQLTSILPAADVFLEPQGRAALHKFVEQLYNYWRSRDRYIVLLVEPGPGNCRGQRPHRAFNDTLIGLGHHIRSLYRNVCENITGDHPRIYRHVAAGCKVGLVAVSGHCELPSVYETLLGKIPLVRQVWFTPPMILNFPVGLRSDQLLRIDGNPLPSLALQQEDWLCYPAQVGHAVVFIFFHQQVIGRGVSLANLFELATDDQIAAGPDAVGLFGVSSQHMEQFGDSSAVCFDDRDNDLLVAAISLEDYQDSFGCLKDMALTLHNIIMVRRGRLPFHGSLVNICFRKEEYRKTVLVIGDKRTEILAALRSSDSSAVIEMSIIADDTGSLMIGDGGSVVGSGTGCGVLLRLDMLQEGDTCKQMDRAIFMNPQASTGRVLLPVNTIEEVLKGYGIDLLLLVSAPEATGAAHPPVEMLEDSEQALRVFSTLQNRLFSSSGMRQYEKHKEELAGNIFREALQSACRIAHLRTGRNWPDADVRDVIKLIEADA